MRNKSFKADFYLFGLTLVWGTTFTLVKLAISDCSPFLFVFLRFLLGSLLLFLFFPKKFFPVDSKTALAGILIGLFLFLGFALQTQGLKYTTASKSAFITGLFVVLVPPLAVIFAKEKLRWNIILGVILAVMGLWFLTSPKFDKLNPGDILTFFGAISFAFQVVLVEIYTKKYDFLKLTLLQLVATTIFALISLFFFEKTYFTLTNNLMVGLFVTATLATALGIYVQNRYQKESTAARAAIIYTVEPVVAFLFAFLVLNEIFGVSSLIGAGFILAGMLASELGRG